MTQTDPNLFNYEEEECFDEASRLWVSWWWLIVVALVLGFLAGVLVRSLLL